MMYSTVLHDDLMALPKVELVTRLIQVYDKLDKTRGSFQFGMSNGKVDKISIESMMSTISGQFEGVW